MKYHKWSNIIIMIVIINIIVVAIIIKMIIAFIGISKNIRNG